MEPKYKVGQVVIIAEDIDGFKESEHRHLTNIMEKAYGDLALIVDVKPDKGITCSKEDDGFNYYLKILRDKSYVKECESEYWTSELFEDSTTPLFKINDIVHFWDSQQYDKSIIYKVESYFKDENDSGDFVVGYNLVDVNNPDSDYCADAYDAKYLELVNVKQVDITKPSLVSDYSRDVELTKQLTQLQQKVEEYENRLCKQKESITGSGRPGELGIFNRANQIGFGRSEVNYSEIALSGRKRVGFLKN